MSVVYKFGAFKLDPGRGLSKAGNLLPLPPKEFSVLELLVMRHGDIVSHADLLDHAWPDQQVTEESITRCIYVLRKLMLDNKQSIIKTVPKRGYRFDSPVSEVSRSTKPSLIEKSIRTSSEAYSHFLEGMREANMSGSEHLERACVLFEQACKSDRDYAVPLGAIADCRIYQIIRGWITPLEGLPKARHACEKALTIDPELASAHAALGWIEGVMCRNTESGLSMIETALTLDPEYAKAFSYRGWIERCAGELEASVESLRLALDRDPHSILYTHAYAWSLFCARHFDEALELERRTVLETPWSDVAHAYLSIAAGWLGHQDEAIKSGQTMLELAHDDPFGKTVMAWVYARAGDNNSALALLKAAESDAHFKVPRPQLVMVYAELGQRDQVIALLEEARDEFCPWFPAALYDPRLGMFADDPDVLKVFEL